MHKLVRSVRFSVNPFLAKDALGFNSFASKPTGEGLAIFLELSIGVIGEADSDTGFVINVVKIDELVREMMRPMLRDWLDNNLPGMVERLVKQEIQRLTRSQ